MPMPTPNSGETQDAFVGRCMGSDVMVSDYPDESQRTAVCHAQWKSNMSRFAKSFQMDAEVFAVGRWNGMDFTLEDLMQIANAFHALGDNHRIPVKLGHNDSQPMTDGHPALGWVSDVWVNRQSEKLIVRFSDMPEVVYNAVQAKLYRNVSIELDVGVEHKGKYYPFVLSGVALLGADIPAVNTLADLTAYMERGSFEFTKEGTVHFTVSDVNLNKHEVNTMADKDDEVTLANLNATIKAMQVQMSKDAESRASLEQQNAELRADLKAKDELDAHRKQLDQRKDTFSKLEKMVTDKKISPATRDEFERDYDNAANERERELVVYSISRLEKTIETNPQYFGAEQARANDERKRNESDKSPDEILRTRTKEYMAKHGEKDFNRAKRAVMEADPELADKYAKMTEVA